MVSKVLSEGFQMEAEAFAFLSALPLAVDRAALMKVVMEKKRGENQGTVIRRSDLEEVLPHDVTLEDEEGLHVSGEPGELEIVSDPTPQVAPAEAGVGFKRLIQDRYWRLLGIARQRPDSKNIVDIQSVKGGAANKVKIAGLVSDRNSRRESVELVIDDPTGSARLQCGDELASAALRVPLDSFVVAEVSSGRSGQLFASSLVLPDVPSRKPTASSHRVYAVLLSDLHIGSRMFLREDFQRFLLWLNGKAGDLDIVSRIKYAVVAGDIVDGIGVYPGQELQLSERDLRKQYALAAEMVGCIPGHLKVVVAPGNHDAVRQALPQPAVPSDLAAPLYELPNVKNVGNPTSVKLDGVNFLIYHGRSLDDVIATIPDLTYSRPAAAMQVLLKCRHLAPMYGMRTALSPELRDMLVIDPVPDVFHAGHVHAVDVLDYRGTLIVNSGTFQAQTPFQANMGLEPTASIVPIVNLSTLEVIKRSFARPVLPQAS